MFLESSADIVVYGGAAGGGKSFGLHLDMTRHLHNPRFAGTILRRTHAQVTQNGGLWDSSMEIFPLLGGTPNMSKLFWKFRSGAKVSYDYLDKPNDHLKYQGAELAVIHWDELTHFRESQFWYLYSRNRSTCGVHPYMRCTTNPDADTWVADLISWWIDEYTGYPIPERSGVIRYFLRDGDEIVWGATPEECLDGMHGKLTGDEEPTSFTFIAAGLEDNPALTNKDPKYRSRLAAMSSVDRERLLGGNWKIRQLDGAEWGDQYFELLWPDYWPNSFERSVIAVDPSKGQDPAKGDYCAIVFAGLSGGHTWVDSQIQRLPIEKLADAVVEAYVRYRPDAIVLESNANQDISFGREIRRVARERGLAFIPLRLVNNNRPKHLRIFDLNPIITGKLLRFRPGSRSCKILERQLRGFPLPDVHDDGPDALEMAVRTLVTLAIEGMA